MAGPSDTTMQGELRTALNEVHSTLLHIHKALLDHERRKYEAANGSIEASAILQVIISDPWFAWLKTLSALITQIDEFTEGDDPLDLTAGRALLTQARQLVAPREDGTPFQREYLRVIQEYPETASLHGQWKQLLQSPIMQRATAV